MTNPARLSGPRHLDSFIVTPNFRPLIGILPARTTETNPLPGLFSRSVGRAKTHANPDADGT